MWPVSARFLSGLKKSHIQIARVDILTSGAPILSINSATPRVVDPFTLGPLASISGKVDVSKSNIRRSGSVDLLNTDGLLTESEIREVFQPLRNEFRLYSGIIYPDATADEVIAGTDRELVPIGTFVIDKVSSNWPRVTLSGYDRMWIVQRSVFRNVYTVPAGQAVFGAIQAMYSDALPSAKAAFNFPTTDDTTPLAVYDEGSDRADAGQQLATSIGYTVYCDPMGTFVADNEPYPTADNVQARYTPGTDSVMLRPDREVSGTDAYNAVIAKGDSPDSTVAAPRGYAQDDNPASLTYVGDVGIFPYTYSSPLLNTTDKAAAAAKTILARELGLSDSIVVPIVPNPAHEVNDVIYVVDPSQDIDSVLIVDSFSVGLQASDGAMSIACRSQVFS